MKSVSSLSIAVAVLLGLVTAAAGAEPKADAKATFTQLKCNSCHAVSSQGIAAVEEEGEGEEGEEAVKPSDLSNVGATRSASWIKDWLQKKVDVDGKKHRKKFEGTPAQLDSLATWLASLKTAAK